MPVTRRQREILDYISTHIDEKGYAPSFEEIARQFGFQSLATVHEHLTNLERKGYIRRTHNESRAIEVVPPKGQTGATELPLLGLVAAGAPILAEENIEEYLEVPDVIGGEDGDYILQIRGESMKNAGILEGDYVVVRPSDDAGNGEIVVALIGEEATVKRIYREPDHIRLQPENDEMDPIITTEARVLGKVVGVFRKV